MADLKVTGMEQFRRVLDQLPGNVQRRVFRKSMNAATQHLLKAARRNERKKSGKLKKNMAKKVYASRVKGTVTGIVGAKRTGDKPSPTRYVHLEENGHIDAKTGRFVPGSKSIKRAAEETRSASLGEFTQRMGREIEDEAAKLAGGPRPA